MSQLHVNILKLLQEKKNVKISITKARKLRDSLKKLHEETTGCGQESFNYFAVPLQQQQQETSSLTNAPVPHFLESVTRFILENHAAQEGILRKNGNERRANSLKNIMEENGAQIPTGEYSVHDVTCVLKRWLRCLPEPVVPRLLHDVFAKCVELESSHHHRTQALLLSCLLLPTFHLNTLKHVAVFLQEIAKNDLRNKMTSANLAKVLAPSLMPRIVKVETEPELAKKFSDLSTVVVQVLIDNASLIGILPPEYESLRESRTKDFMSEDDLSDHETERHSKKKLFTFLKPKGTTGNRALGLRTPQLQAKRTAVSKLVPQSCPPKMSKTKRNSLSSHTLRETLRSANNIENPFSSPPLQNEKQTEQSTVSTTRVTRSNSRKQAEESAKVALIRRGFEAGVVKKDSGRNLQRQSASVCSLPAHSSQAMTRQQRQRALVRRAVTVRAAMKYSYTQTANRTAMKASADHSSTSAKRTTVKLSPGANGMCCSPRKPPRTSRHNDAVAKGLRALTRVTKPGVDEDVVEPNDCPASNIDSMDTFDVGAAAEDVAESIGRLSVFQRKSPRVSSRRSGEHLGQQNEHAEKTQPIEMEVDGTESLHGMKTNNKAEAEAEEEEEEFVLRTVKEETQMPPQISTGSSAGGLEHVEWKSADHSGTCVDSEDEGHNFIDGELFIGRLKEPVLHEKDPKTFTPSLTSDTPVRSEPRSAASTRESVIAIRTSRAGFVRRNVREIEHNFATPVGGAVRTRRPNTPVASFNSRLEIPTSLTSVAERKLPGRSAAPRRPLTPANTKRTISSRVSSTKGQLNDLIVTSAGTIDI